MREIKFRGIFVDTEAWVYGYLIRYGADNVIFDNLTHTYYRVKHETVGQYIGRKDKNGWENFEGDVVKKIDCFPGSEGDEIIESIGIVKWSKSWPMFSVQLIKGEDESFEHSEGINFCWEELEIIGSIHENPELLR